MFTRTHSEPAWLPYFFEKDIWRNVSVSFQWTSMGYNVVYNIFKYIFEIKLSGLVSK